MQIYINISLSLVLILMSIQDFKYRAVSWFAFPALAVFLLLSNRNFTITGTAVNAGFVVLNFALATLFFSLKNRRFVNLLDQHIGLGDILTLLCLSFYFHPVNFFVFYLLSLILISIGAGMYILLTKPIQYTVPLAGLQCLMLLCFMITGWFGGLELNNANWLETYLL